MLIRFLPLLLLAFSLACISGVTGSGDDSDDDRGNAGAAIIVVTVTPGPETNALADFPGQLSPPPATRSPVPMRTPESRTGEEANDVVPEPTEAPDDSEDGDEALVEPPEAPTDEEPTATLEPMATEPSGQQATATPVPATATLIPTSTPVPAAATAVQPAPTGLSAVEGSLLSAHNDIRATAGLAAFSADPTLMTIARQRAQTMANTQAFSHYNPDGTTVFNMMNAYGHPYSDGRENIHYNYGMGADSSWQAAMTGFLNSWEHNQNIHQPHFRKIGVAVAQGSNGYFYYAVVFSD